MSEEITCFYIMTLKTGQLAPFKNLVGEIVKVVRNEPGTLKYQYCIDEDLKTLTIEETYRDSASLLFHAEKTFAPIAERFLQSVDINKLFVFGSPNEEAKSKLKGFSAIFMNSMDGFGRS